LLGATSPIRNSKEPVFDFKLMELLEERLPDIGDGHLTSKVG
jgi:hypothetical protein